MNEKTKGAPALAETGRAGAECLMVIMAFDYGDVRTGVAVCDKMELLASPVAVVKENYQPKLIEKLLPLIAEKQPELLVVGLPKNMDGSLGFRAQACLDFAEKLTERSGVPHEMVDERLSSVTHEMVDERLSSVMAHNALHQVGKKEKKHGAVVDAVAATEILDRYLTWRKNAK